MTDKDAPTDAVTDAATKTGTDTVKTPADDLADDDESRGLARDFSAFAELEHERRRNSFDDFDPELFAEAVRMVKDKLRV